MSKTTEKVSPTSGSILETQVARLKELFPEVVTEGKVDFEKLKATLGNLVENKEERFSFGWAGKNNALSCKHRAAPR